MHTYLLLALAGIAQCAPGKEVAFSKRLDNGVGRTPAMGFNNWNAGLPSSANTALAAANAFVTLGLKDVGYQYINIDDAWSTSSRGNGLLVPDPNKWPNGIKPVTTKIHNMGLKMGLYGDSGTKTCSGYPGSQGYETVDAKTLAEWGIDLWKYDNCNAPNTNQQARYTTMRNALQSSGRNIYYAMCNWGQDSVHTWGNATGNSWRITGDVTNAWSAIVSIATYGEGLARYAGPGGFNDFDMLEIGNNGLTENEERAHFGIWAIAKSPLLIGTDLTKINSRSLAILKNVDIIAINQDSLGKPATYFRPSGAPAPQNGALYPYWAGLLSDGVVVGLVAPNGPTTLSVNLSDVPNLGSGTYRWKEAYSGNTGNGTSIRATLGSHDMEIFRVFFS
ncbi:alpha-galactosidase [Paraphaeosphaeria sporulosa]